MWISNYWWRSTGQHLRVTTNLYEEALRTRRGIHLCSIAIAKAFNAIKRQHIWKTLDERDQMRNLLSESFINIIGLKQDVFSPLYFLIWHWITQSKSVRQQWKKIHIECWNMEYSWGEKIWFTNKYIKYFKWTIAKGKEGKAKWW